MRICILFARSRATRIPFIGDEEYICSITVAALSELCFSSTVRTRSRKRAQLVRRRVPAATYLHSSNMRTLVTIHASLLSSTIHTPSTTSVFVSVWTHLGTERTSRLTCARRVPICRMVAQETSVICGDQWRPTHERQPGQGVHHPEPEVLHAGAWWGRAGDADYGEYEKILMHGGDLFLDIRFSKLAVLSRLWANAYMMWVTCRLTGYARTINIDRHRHVSALSNSAC